MTVTIALDNFYGETPDTVADKVRALPANQGLNDNDMWAKIDAEVVAVAAAQPTKYRPLTTYTQPQGGLSATKGHTGNKHGNK